VLEEEPFRRAGVTMSLDQDVDHIPVLIHGPPQIVTPTPNLHDPHAVADNLRREPVPQYVVRFIFIRRVWRNGRQLDSTIRVPSTTSPDW